MASSPKRTVEYPHKTLDQATRSGSAEAGKLAEVPLCAADLGDP